MTRILLTGLFATILLASCNSGPKEYPQTETGAATAFIRHILDNQLDEAEKMILDDEANRQYFDIIRQQYAKKGKEELEKFKSADIIINEIGNVTDTVCIVNYSNSYDRELKNKVKVVRINGKWLIDLKYTFSGNL
ncbi:MAG: hypothetical protein IPP31_09625 [Chitinophagaceae bacterium]|nr:hypothetical protein [Chitinophagaceae bacterium]